MSRLGFVDKLESIQVGPGAEVVLYEDCFEGRSRTLTGPFSVAVFSDFFNVVSSIKIYETSTVIYDKVTIWDQRRKLTGRKVSFGEGRHSCEEMEDLQFRDKGSSIKILLGYSATVYSGCYSGEEWQITGPVEILNIEDYSLKHINSMRVYKNSDNPDYTGIYSYTQENYRGHETEHALGEYKCDYW